MYVHAQNYRIYSTAALCIENRRFISHKFGASDKLLLLNMWCADRQNGSSARFKLGTVW